MINLKIKFVDYSRPISLQARNIELNIISPNINVNFPINTVKQR